MAPAERSDQALEQWLPVIDGLHIGQLVEIEAGLASAASSSTGFQNKGFLRLPS